MVSPHQSSDAFRRTIHQLFLVAGGAMLLLLAVTLSIGTIFNKPSLIYLSMAVVAFLIPALGGASRGRQFDIFEPINIAAATILYGTTLRAFYLLFYDSPRAYDLMLGQTFSMINAGVIWVIVGLVAFTAGYLFFSARVRLDRLGFVAAYRLDRRRFYYAAAFSLIAGLVGTVLFIQRFAINLGDLTSSSMKHAAEYVTDDGDVVYGAGWETFLGQFAQYGFMLYVGAVLSRQLKLTPFTLALGAVLLLLSTLVPFLNSARTPLIVLIFACCAMAYYYRKIRLRTIVLMIVSLSMLVAVLGQLRAANQRVAPNQGFLDAVMGTGNGFDTVRTVAIFDRVKQQDLFLNGQSYASLATAFIPRQIWPEKPPTGLGGWVKSELFGLSVRTGGWPPGLVAEAYANFGYAGIPIVMFLIGGLLATIYRSCRPYLGSSLSLTVLYSVCLYKLAFNTVSLDFTQGFSGVLGLAIPMIIFLAIARKPLARNLRPNLASGAVRVRTPG